MRQVVDLTNPTPRSPLWLVLAGWTVVVVVMAVILSAQVKVPFPYALVSAAVDYYTLALLATGVWRASAQFSQRRWPLVRLVSAHVALALAVIVSWKLVYILYLRLAIGPRFWDVAGMSQSWMFQLFTAAAIYGVVLGMSLAIQASRRAYEQERRQAEMAILARDAELSAVKAQVQPHFLFNTLNSILVLIETDPPQARLMVARLAELLHASFSRLEQEQVPLEEELALVQAYLDIEKIRFQSRLETHIEIDPAARAQRVPPFLLQPLVENAIKHGIAPHARPGEVSVHARVQAGSVVITIVDSGQGMNPGDTRNGGRGLELTRRRLEALYGSNYRLSFEHQGQRFATELRIPLTGDALYINPAPGC